jgi:hydrogenase maturation factor HypF (carbamoyltransferase family)
LNACIVIEAILKFDAVKQEGFYFTDLNCTNLKPDIAQRQLISLLAQGYIDTVRGQAGGSALFCLTKNQNKLEELREAIEYSQPRAN